MTNVSLSFKEDGNDGYGCYFSFLLFFFIMILKIQHNLAIYFKL